MKYLIWDFDHTLGYRQGGWWGILADMVRREVGISPAPEDIRSLLSSGFPWQAPETPHTGLDTPAKWWDALDGMFARALGRCGVAPARSEALARQVREVYLDPQAFVLYEDTLPTLAALSEQGWAHLLLTNHVPGFEGIAASLGLTQWIQSIFNSAVTGYEKPHPEAFRQVLASIPQAEAVWMIGDNLAADVRGAEALGIPAILVRQPQDGARWYAPDLTGVAAILAQSIQQIAQH